MPLTNEHLFKKKTAILHITLSRDYTANSKKPKTKSKSSGMQSNLICTPFIHPSASSWQMAQGGKHEKEEGEEEAGQEDKEGLLSCYVIRSDREEWIRE